MEDDRSRREDAAAELPSRREFIGGAIAVSGLAMSGLLEAGAAPVASEAAATTQTGAAAAQTPLQVAEIASQNGKLRAVLSLKNANRTMPVDPGMGPASGQVRMLRYFEGKDASGRVVWPPPASGAAPPPPLPGPTLRARVGDQVEITFLNHVDPSQLGRDFDRSEEGIDSCNTVVSSDGERLYPQGFNDTAPNCFHGSTTSNIHFHGTHVTPDGLGDNVLLQLRPDASVTEESVRRHFAEIFAAGPPSRWSQLPRRWRNKQLDLLKRYDKKAPWKGSRGLPPANQLYPPTLARIEAGLWPQYQIGAYPYCFALTKYGAAPPAPGAVQMGQSAGTHWYHAHKHGSTSVNVYNGMAGAFIIEGEYDEALRAIDPRLKEREQVFLVQNFSDAPTLLRLLPGNTSKLGPPATFVNGHANPRVTMQPGEVRLWRFVNASVTGITTLTGFETKNGLKPEVRQIAQDGVQFRLENYKAQPNLGRAHMFAAGNRMDLLVQAPMQPPGQRQEYTFTITDTVTKQPAALLTLEVAGDPISPPMAFPTDANYPALPPFHEDIPSVGIKIHRTLDFGLTTGHFVIDGQLFGGDRYDQTMVLGDTEEWTIINSTGVIAHPFHIHVNPFQVVEIYDPVVGTYAPSQHFVWQDVIAIPPRAPDKVSGELKNGYVRIRHRFVDFAGSYVLHCHLLEHEDRGMMQLVRVISANAEVPHH